MNQSINEQTTVTNSSTTGEIFPVHKMEEALVKESRPPADLIAPRVLVHGETAILGGPAKSGKTDFLISWLIHLAAGEEFLGFKPPRPLNVVYLQAEGRYPYFRERIQLSRLDDLLQGVAGKNLSIIADIPLILDEEGVDRIRRTILFNLEDKPVDIIAIDSLQSVFDYTLGDITTYRGLQSFMDERLEKLRDSVNPKAGIILTHNTRRQTPQEMESDAFGGFGHIRHFSICDISMFAERNDPSVKKLKFALNLGPRIKPKIVRRSNGKWSEIRGARPEEVKASV